MDGQNLAKQALAQIPSPAPDAKRIVGLVKEGGRITGYQLSDSSIVENSRLWTWPNKVRSPTGARRNI